MKKIHPLSGSLLLAGMLVTFLPCSPRTKEKNTGSAKPDPARIRETAIQAARWSLDHNLELMGYSNMRAAYGILKVAAVTGNDSLRQAVESKFRPELPEGASPQRDNDAVIQRYGDLAEHGFGTLAEYVCAPERNWRGLAVLWGRPHKGESSHPCRQR